jgi:hypothetical protein
LSMMGCLLQRTRTSIQRMGKLRYEMLSYIHDENLNVIVDVVELASHSG